MSTNPSVSICILTFNSEAFITEAIESALNQAINNIEIVIVDNCSNDNTVEICQRFKNQDDRICIYQNTAPLGISGGLNSCLDKAKGEYVKFLMHDDSLEPTCLEKMIGIFNRFPSVSLVSCSEHLVKEDGSPIQALKPSDQSGLVSGRKIAKEILYKMSNIIGTPTSVLMKRSGYGDGFKRSLFLFQDAQVYVQALLGGDYYFIDEPLSQTRVHSGTGSSINSNTLVFLGDLLQLKNMYSDFMQEEGLSPSEWENLIDERILGYVGHMLFEQKISEQSVRSYAHKLRNLVGHDYTDQLLESMAYIIFYGYSRLFNLDLETKWQQKENKRLTQEIQSMANSLPFRATQPFRDLKSKFFNMPDVSS